MRSTGEKHVLSEGQNGAGVIGEASRLQSILELADLSLSQGNTAEAERLFREAGKLRGDHLQRQASEAERGSGIIPDVHPATEISQKAASSRKFQPGGLDGRGGPTSNLFRNALFSAVPGSRQKHQKQQECGGSSRNHQQQQLMVDGGTSVSNRQSKAVGGGTQDGDKSVAVKDGGKPQNQVPNPAVNNNTLQESSMGEPMREVHLLDETLTTSSSTGVSSSPPSSSQAALVTSTTLENSTDTDEIHPGQKDAGLDLLDSTQCQADHHISSERSDPSLEPHAQPHVSNELPCKQDEKEVDGSGQEEEEEDWEASWGEGLCQLKPAALVKISRAPPPVTVAIKQTNPIATVNLVKDVEGTVPPGTSERLDHPAAHVLEMYGLTREVKSTDLEAFLNQVWDQCGGSEGKVQPLIRWVDDEHALLVCPDMTSARVLLNLDQQRFLLRSHDQASPGGRDYPGLELMAPKPRPRTTAAVAKRLLGHALGMPSLRDKEAEAELGQHRQAARQARKDKEAAKEAAWVDG